MTLSDGLFSEADLRLIELELLVTLKWLLNPPTVHASIHLLLVLFEGAIDVASVGRRALRYADLVRSDLEFLRYPPSMIAVASVICALKQKGVEMHVVSDWMRRVHDCHLPYTDRPDAARSITDCGLRLIALDGGELALSRTCDAEVEHATANHSSAISTTDEDDDSEDADMDRTSPNNVMDVDQIEAYQNGPEQIFTSKLH